MKVFSAEFGGVVSFGGTRGNPQSFLSEIKLSTNLRKFPVMRNSIVKVNSQGKQDLNFHEAKEKKVESQESFSKCS